MNLNISDLATIISLVSLVVAFVLTRLIEEES